MALELRASVGGMTPSSLHGTRVQPGSSRQNSSRSLTAEPLPSFRVLEGGERHTEKLQARSHLPSLPCSWAFAVRRICLLARSQQLGAKEAETVGTLSWREWWQQPEAPSGFPRQCRVWVMVSAGQELSGALFEATYPPRLVLQAFQRRTEIVKIFNA